MVYLLWVWFCFVDLGCLVFNIVLICFDFGLLCGGWAFSVSLWFEVCLLILCFVIHGLRCTSFICLFCGKDLVGVCVVDGRYFLWVALVCCNCCVE